MPPPPDSPASRAARTARWATIMARWAIRYATSGKRPATKAVTRWQVVAFPGPNGSESRGIVDVLAIRKDHAPRADGLLRGDYFEIVLLQIKGGTAPWPSVKDLARLREVRRYHRAKAVVLACWTKGKRLEFFRMALVWTHPKNAWVPADPAEIFGQRGGARRRLSARAS